MCRGRWSGCSISRQAEQEIEEYVIHTPGSVSSIDTLVGISRRQLVLTQLLRTGGRLNDSDNCAVIRAI